MYFINYFANCTIILYFVINLQLIWDDDEKYDSWHKYLSFNSMLLFHPSYKYFCVSFSLIYQGDPDSDDQFDDLKRKLESNPLTAFYAQKKFFILIFLSVVPQQYNI